MITDNESTFEDGEGEKAPEGKEPASTLERHALFTRLRHWFLIDKRHSEDWRQDAEQEFEFVAGRQWSAQDMAALRESMRPIIAFNRIAPVISAVAGTEVTNRQEVRYLPRTPGDAIPDEMLTNAAKWFRDECNGEDEESDAFWDNLVCGMGWTDTRMDFERDRDGAPILDRVDPLEMFWDAAAKARNLEDRRRDWRVRKVTLEEAKALVGNYDASDEEFDAKWANFDDRGNKDETRQEARFYRPTKEGGVDLQDDDLITLVEVNWWERETVHAVATESGTEFLSEEDHSTLIERTQKLGMPAPKSVKQTRRKYFRAWIGETVLAEPEEAPFGEHFHYQCMTGFRDRNKGTFYGLVRSMIDPQKWANKWLSQTMHIMNTGAKGGALVEDGAFVDEREAEKNWGQPDKFVKLTKGTLSNPNGPKIQAKPATPTPPDSLNLMEFAIQSIRDVGGVNLELLGQKDTEQPGVLEAQRKKQAMAVLAVMFDSLRRYRKNQGRLLLWLIQNFVSDGRLIRITQDNGKPAYLPFIRNPEWSEYDVIVDDAPTNPQQKEIAWMTMMQVLPAVGKIPPQIMGWMMKYSPLPASASEEFQRVLQEMQQAAAQQPNPLQAKMAEVEMNSQIKMKELEVDTELKRQQMMADIQIEREKMQHSHQLKLDTYQMDTQFRMQDQEKQAAEQAESKQSSDQLGQVLTALAKGEAAIMQGISQLVEHENAETELLRDPETGRAMGARKVRRQAMQ